MKNIVIGVIGLSVVGVAGAARAADFPAQPYTKAAPAYVATVYNWSGFYLGANGGWGGAGNSWDLQAPGGPFHEGREWANGGTVGGQVGYRWQSGPMVYGVEAQGNWANLSGRNTSLAVLNAGLDYHSNLDAFGLFTGQVGYAWNNALLYAKGGAAVTDTQYKDMITGTSTVVASTGDTRWGGVVGAGVEYGFAPNWSAAIEYDHLFMGKNTDNLNGAAGLFATDSIRQDVNLATLRLNYKFAAPVMAKY